eukprot:5657815-Ditylum_brightwellii.AAC.1
MRAIQEEEKRPLTKKDDFNSWEGKLPEFLKIHLSQDPLGLIVLSAVPCNVFKSALGDSSVEVEIK